MTNKCLLEERRAYIIVRAGLLRKLPKEEMFAQVHKAQGINFITYHSSDLGSKL
ncbi:MAG: hypothetical protein KAH18_01085 [Psychromonas sp.]|nr:hypothetical protein [Psychromonas sp.]